MLSLLEIRSWRMSLTEHYTIWQGIIFNTKINIEKGYAYLLNQQQQGLQHFPRFFLLSTWF